MAEINHTIIEKIKRKSITLADINNPNEKINLIKEFHETADSKRLKSIKDLEHQGFTKNEFCHWINSKEETARPLIIGRMNGQYDFSRKGWISGEGRTAVWRDIPFESKTIEPQFLLKDIDLTSSKFIGGYKIAINNITSSTNERTLVCSLNRDFPYGHTVSILYLNNPTLVNTAVLCAFLNSFIVDFSIRDTFNGLNLGAEDINLIPLIDFDKIPKNVQNYITLLVSQLSFIHFIYAPDWIYLKKLCNLNEPLQKYFALTYHERLRIRAIIEALIAFYYNIDLKDFQTILSPDQKNPKGFWRVDNNYPEEIRLTNLSLNAYEQLIIDGVDKFISTDWQIPQKIQIKHLDLLGSRYLEKQLKQNIEESWVECMQKAKLYLHEDRFNHLIELIDKREDPIALWNKHLD